jgi:hypothetical protein
VPCGCVYLVAVTGPVFVPGIGAWWLRLAGSCSTDPVFVPSKDTVFVPDKVPVFVPGKDPVFVPDKEPVFVPGKDPVFVPDKEPAFVPGKDPVFVPHKDPVFVPGKDSVFVSDKDPVFVPGKDPVFVPGTGAWWLRLAGCWLVSCWRPRATRSQCKTALGTGCKPAAQNVAEALETGR